MGLFKREEKEKRTLEDMIKPMDEEISEYKDYGDEIEKGKDANIEKSEDSEDNRDIKSIALSCFGAREDKSEKWIIKCTQVWYAIMSFFWFLVGALTFAPVMFICDNINVLFKNKIKSLIVSLIIWCAIVLLFIVLIVTRNSNSVKEVAETLGTQIR